MSVAKPSERQNPAADVDLWFPEGRSVTGLYILILWTFCWRSMMEAIEDLILVFGVPAMLQVKPWKARGASHHSLMWPTIIRTIFGLINPLDEFSFKEMSMWGKSKISSCCLCVWCKSKELGGRGSTRLPTTMVESFSADFFPAIARYWAEPHLEFCQISTTELLCKNMWSIFRWLG